MIVFLDISFVCFSLLISITLTQKVLIKKMHNKTKIFAYSLSAL